MKKSLKFFLSLLLLNLLAFSAFSEGYHVCVSSYKSLKNAEAMVRKLESQSVSAFINENKVKDESYYRVLLSKEFKKIADARRYRDEVEGYSFVRELGLKGFWVCTGDKSRAVASKQPAQKPKPEPKKKAKPPKPKPAPVEAAPVEPAPAPVEVAPVEVAPIPEPPVKNTEPEPAPEPAPAPEVPPVVVAEPEPEEPATTLVKNKKSVLSEETPYSVLVRSYKYAQFAENDSGRLKELGFDSYLVNTFDDTAFFSFDIHVGAFASRAEAQELQEQFTEAGILDTEVSDFKDIEAKIRRYDEVISAENVTFDDGQSALPTGLPASVEKLVRQFPANKDFPIQEISIVDYESYQLSETKPDISAAILKAIGNERGVHSALLATYRDELYRKSVSVFFVNAELFVFDEPLGEVETMQFGARSGVFDCNLYETDGELMLCGENLSERLFVQIKTKDFTKEEFISFLIDSFNDSSLELYPQMRRTFFVLPDENPAVQRDFICFDFKKVDENYALDRGNAAWAQPIVGHSLAKSYYSERYSLVCLGFYDLDYNFNAKSVHEHFMSSKNTSDISDRNQGVTVNGVDGWYLMNATQKEVSFSTKSYVIAVDTEPGSALEKDDLVSFGKELKIWDAPASGSADSVIDAK